MLLCFITRRILWNITPSTLSCTSVLLMTFLSSDVGPKVPSWNSLKLSKAKLIESNKVASLFWICFSIEIPLRTCCNFPPFKSLSANPLFTYHSKRFTLLAIREPSLKGIYMLETVLLYETREKFWKRLRVRGYPFRFLLPLFREIRYSGRKKWLYKKPKNRSSMGRTIVFKTSLNNVISTILPELDCIVCYKKTVTLANLCK